MPVYTDWDLKGITVDDILSAQGADPEVIRRRSPRLLETAAKVLEEGLSLAKPQFIINRYHVSKYTHGQLILENGVILKGDLISDLLASAEEVAVCVGTIGEQLERKVSELMQTRLDEALALDSFGSAAVEFLSTRVCHYLENVAKVEGRGISSAISPGYENWTIAEGQPQLFALIDAAEIGITLTPSMMMIPRKSASFVIGFGKNITKKGDHCDFCNLRETCLYRKNKKDLSKTG